MKLDIWIYREALRPMPPPIFREHCKNTCDIQIAPSYDWRSHLAFAMGDTHACDQSFSGHAQAKGQSYPE